MYRFCLIVLLMLLFLSPQLSVAATEISYKTSTLPHYDEVNRYFYEDLDGDGRKEIIALEHLNRKLVIYWQSKDGFDLANEQEIQISSDTLGCDFAEVLPIGGRELILLKIDRVNAISFRGRTPSSEKEVTLYRLPVFDMDMLRTSHTGSLKKYSLAKDMNGDNKDDLIIPVYDGLMVLYVTDNGSVNAQKIPYVRKPVTRRTFNVEGMTNGQTLLGSQVGWWLFLPQTDLYAPGKDFFKLTYTRTVNIPSTEFVDENQDSLIDIISSDTLFIQMPDGSFQKKGIMKTRERTTLNGMVLLRKKVSDEEWKIHDMRADINGDGKKEYILSQSRVSVFTPKTEIWVFAEDAVEEPEKAKPQWHFIMKGLPIHHGSISGSAPLSLHDLDKDGALDLILLTLEFRGASVRSHLKSFLRKGIEGHLEFFLWKNGEGFPSQPSFKIPVKIDYNAFMARWETLMKIIYDKDFDGDGNGDLCITQGTRGIKVYRFVSAEKGYDLDPIVDMETPDTIVDIKVLELNGDNIADLVVKTFNAALKRHYRVVYLSRND